MVFQCILSSLRTCSTNISNFNSILVRGNVPLLCHNCAGLSLNPASSRIPKRYFKSLPKVWQLNTEAASSPRQAGGVGKFAVNPAGTQEVKNEEVDKEALLARLKERSILGEKRLLEEPEEEMEPHVIYQGTLSHQFKMVKLFSLTTSMGGLCIQPVIIMKSAEVPLVANIAVLGMVGFFTYVTPFLIHTIAKKYITEMVYDPRTDEYKAITYTFFLRKKETVFKADDVKVPEVAGPFTTANIKSKDGKIVPLFFAPEAFVKTSHYGRLMGYDKPVDLHLGRDQIDQNKPKKS